MKNFAPSFLQVTDHTNLLTVISNKKLNYERLDSPIIQVEINATDDGSPRQSFIKKLNITVNETNEGANEISLNPDHVIFNETAAIGTNISELVCNNPEKWQNLEYTLINHTIFKIVKVPYTAIYDPPILNKLGVKQSSFELQRSFLFLNESFLNYDISPWYDILVQVTDEGIPTKSFTGIVIVNVSRVNPCVPANNCSINALCSRIDGFRYDCWCLDGFTGDGFNCTEIDDCLNSSLYCEGDETTENPECPPCKNNATCHDEHLTFNCTCLPGFNGTQCGQNIDECIPENFKYQCSKQSICLDGINNITCECDRGFTDWLCNTEINECIPNPCGDHGRCKDHIGKFLFDRFA